MYVNLRRYSNIGVDKEAIERSVEEELLSQLRIQSGFCGYCAFWDDEDAGVSVSVFEDQEAAHRSTDTARRWVMRHLDFFPERGEEFSGECVAQEVPRDQEQAAGMGQQLPYVLVRMLVGVPATQDTLAFVQQRTLPMVTRSPGFRGVYMIRSDKDQGQAMVVTLFDCKRHAESCHSEAVALLKEGLPSVAVARVVQGQSVIFRLGHQ
jgi:heme-degrading monooxygenase HmoA